MSDTLPFSTSAHQANVASGSKNPLGERFIIGDEEYVLVEVDEATGVARRRALTYKSRSGYTVDYTNAVTDTIAGFVPDDLVGTAEDGAGVLMQTKGEITLPVSSETIADGASLYWNKSAHRATATAGSDAMYIGENKGAVADTATTLVCMLDITPDWFNAVA